MSLSIEPEVNRPRSCGDAAIQNGPGLDRCLGVVLGRDGDPMVGLELGLPAEADRMKALVVEPIDVLDDSDLDVAGWLPAALGA